MIKTIATDLDGTLFYPKRKTRLLSSKNAKFLRSFTRTEGNHVILVSGRNIGLVERVAKKIEYEKLSMIACNGSIIYHNKKVIYENPIPREDVIELSEKFKRCSDIVGTFYMINEHSFIVVPNDISCIVSFVAKIGISLQGAYREKFKYGNKHFIKALKNENVKFYKVMPIFGFGKKGEAQARKQCDILREEFKEKFEIMYSGTSVELMKKDVNKANALKNLLDMLKLDESQTAVIGDSGNDIPLFEEFENSFCMENAPDEVKQKAKRVVKGVYEIEKFI